MESGVFLIDPVSKSVPAWTVLVVVVESKSPARTLVPLEARLRDEPGPIAPVAVCEKTPKPDVTRRSSRIDPVIDSVPAVMKIWPV